MDSQCRKSMRPTRSELDELQRCLPQMQRRGDDSYPRDYWQTEVTSPIQRRQAAQPRYAATGREDAIGKGSSQRFGIQPSKLIQTVAGSNSYRRDRRLLPV